MSQVLPEPTILPILITNVLGLLLLMMLYFFGVWSRSYILPADRGLSIKRQLVAAVPVGFITMGLYAKTAFPGIHIEGTGVFDLAIMMGYAIFLGMLSRESLEKILGEAKTNPAGVGGVNIPLPPTP